MNLNSPWMAGIVSSLAAFLLAFSIESFRSLPLFWFLYVVLGAAWIAVVATQAKDRTRTFLSIPSLLLLLGIISLFVNFVPLAFALFIVFVNTLPVVRDHRGWRVVGAAFESVVYVAVSFVLVLVGGYVPLIVASAAYVLSAIAIIASVARRIRSGKGSTWADAVAGMALLVVLLGFSDRYASVGAAASAAAVAMLIRASSALKTKKVAESFAGAT